MKNKSNRIVKLALGAGATLFAAGCAGHETLSVSSSMPAAEGTVQCGDAANGNTSLDLKVKHLANPERLTPPASTYVVWLKSDKDAKPQNIGALTVDEDLAGRLTTITPLRRFELFVTGEAAGATQEPVGQPLLWANCNL